MREHTNGCLVKVKVCTLLSAIPADDVEVWGKVSFLLFTFPNLLHCSLTEEDTRGAGGEGGAGGAERGEQV